MHARTPNFHECASDSWRCRFVPVNVHSVQARTQTKHAKALNINCHYRSGCWMPARDGDLNGCRALKKLLSAQLEDRDMISPPPHPTPAQVFELCGVVAVEDPPEHRAGMAG